MFGSKMKTTFRLCSRSSPSISWTLGPVLSGLGNYTALSNQRSFELPWIEHLETLSITSVRRFSAQAEKSLTTTKPEDEEEETSQSLPVPKKRNTKIIKLDPEDYRHTAVGKKRPPLLTRRGEAPTMWSMVSFRIKDEPGRHIDDLAKLQTKIDLRPSAIKQILAAAEAERDIKEQTYKEERVKILGRDLSAAHFIVARKGRVRFMGYNSWISTYQRTDDPGDELSDVPSLRSDPENAHIHYNCTLPVRYDPNFRVEALDANGVQVRYEGLANLEGLNYLKWLSFRDNKFLDDWGLDRIFCNHGDTLEYLDLSGCPGITLCGLSALKRIKNLKMVVLENLSHIKDLDVVCAVLEDEVPGLVCVGADFPKKLEEMKKESIELEDEAARRGIILRLEGGTYTIEVPQQLSDGEATVEEPTTTTKQIQ